MGFPKAYARTFNTLRKNAYSKPPHHVTHYYRTLSRLSANLQRRTNELLLGTDHREWYRLCDYFGALVTST